MSNCATAGNMLPLVRLLQLASPALPIGGFSYSQGLEWVVAEGVVTDAASAQTWIGDAVDFVMARGEAPVAWRLLAAVNRDWPSFARWNAWFGASRETSELRSETEQMGGSLGKLAVDLGLVDSSAQAAMAMSAPLTLPAAFALAARGFAVPADAALAAYVWAWLENQVLCAMKLVPLGQVAGQRMLTAVGARIPEVVATAMTLADDEVSTFAPGIALASARHETQY